MLDGAPLNIFSRCRILCAVRSAPPTTSKFTCTNPPPAISLSRRIALRRVASVHHPRFQHSSRWACHKLFVNLFNRTVNLKGQLHSKCSLYLLSWVNTIVYLLGRLGVEKPYHLCYLLLRVAWCKRWWKRGLMMMTHMLLYVAPKAARSTQLLIYFRISWPNCMINMAIRCWKFAVKLMIAAIY